MLNYLGASFFTELSFFLIITAFLDYPVRWRRLLSASVCLDIAVAPATFLTVIYTNGSQWGTFLGDLIGFAANIAGVLIFFERNAVRALIAAGLGSFCYYQIYVGILAFGADWGLSILRSGIGCAALSFGAGLLFRRLKAADSLEYFMEKRLQRILLLIAALLLAESYYAYLFLADIFSRLAERMPYQSWMLTALFLVLFLYMTFYARHKQREELQDTLLMQQQMYISSLEELQREVRMYRHDYKNMISGVLLQAKEGDTEGVLKFLRDTAENFDESVGRQIQQTTQLANLRQAELKSLVLSKLARMQELGIRYRLEVAKPVEQIGMSSMDLNRCVGILMDNAIEAVCGEKSGSVTLVFSRQEECLTILIGNTLRRGVDVQQIFREGYSTKGRNRGLGLASLERILKKYHNAESMTRVQDGELIQELKIS